MNRRPVASLALCTILGTVFTGCAGRDEAVINADDPWYDLFFYTRQYDDGDIACVSLLDPSGEESPRELFEFRGRESIYDELNLHRITYDPTITFHGS